MRLLKSLFMLLLVLAAVAVLLGLRWFLAMPVVETAAVTRGQAVDAVYATGTVEATIMLPIASRRTARLVSLNVDEGARVTKGALLAQFDDRDMQAALAQLVARHEQAQREYGRLNRIRSSAAFSQAAMDAAETELRASEAALEGARSDLRDLKLTAPEDGTVIRRDGEVGQMIPANQPVFWFTCCAPLRISAEVDEEDIARVKPGQKVLIRADAFPGQIFDGVVKAITPMGDATARSYRVRVGLDGQTPLMIGMTAETNIILSTAEDARLVPRSALQVDRVWVLDAHGQLQPREVKTGARGAEKVQILAGLGDDDRVVKNPREGWRAGQQARLASARWDLPGAIGQALE